MENEEITKARGAQLDLGFEQVKVAGNMKTQFYIHWSTLAGGTATLTVPFMTQLIGVGKMVADVRQFEWAIGLMVVSLLGSALCILLQSNGVRASGWQMISHFLGDQGVSDQHTIKTERYRIARLWTETVAILSYIVGLFFVFTAIFANLTAVN